jgi:hypothetical protein
MSCAAIYMMSFNWVILKIDRRLKNETFRQMRSVCVCVCVVKHAEDIISENLFDRIRVVFYKIRYISFYDNVFVSTLVIPFHETQLDQLSWFVTLQSYCDNSYSRGGVNQMWILKNSKDLLEYIYSRSLSSCNNIKSCDFCTIGLF